MKELGPCPFCGGKVAGSCAGFVTCTNQECHISRLYIPVVTWNNRPGEDAVRREAAARIAELEAFVNEEALDVAVVYHTARENTSKARERDACFFRAFRRLCPGDYASFKDGCDGNDPELFQFLKELEDEDA